MSVGRANATDYAAGEEIVMSVITFRFEEATIEGIHAALRAGETTSRSFVEGYLARIDAYDQDGPSLNAIVGLNGRASLARLSCPTAGSDDAPIATMKCTSPCRGQGAARSLLPPYYRWPLRTISRPYRYNSATV